MPRRARVRAVDAGLVVACLDFEFAVVVQWPIPTSPFPEPRFRDILGRAVGRGRNPRRGGIPLRPLLTRPDPKAANRAQQRQRLVAELNRSSGLSVCCHMERRFSPGRPAARRNRRPRRGRARSSADLQEVPSILPEECAVVDELEGVRVSLSLEQPSQRRADIAQFGVEQPAAFDVSSRVPPVPAAGTRAAEGAIPVSQLVFLAGSR